MATEEALERVIRRCRCVSLICWTGMIFARLSIGAGVFALLVLFEVVTGQCYLCWLGTGLATWWLALGAFALGEWLDRRWRLAEAVERLRRGR